MGWHHGIHLWLVKGAQKNILPESDDTKPRMQMQIRTTEKQCVGLSAKCIITNYNSDTRYSPNFSKQILLRIQISILAAFAIHQPVCKFTE